ncbi:phage head-tail adapter protein [Fusobacterium pseudoperiodonticum]|uniref:phage head-tail adapter protein n=1 Tax=Fusobacterium pseudoperiodonticum TaxID=2663009 RepID=UPI000C1B5011|nr:phage head-tail adapter protein [Fusobacterium pseudoperiodonticum]ATV56763.1 phage head-tail adapter protein [Fusobacterium pseudoperiodonticum]ATV68677.1 phage head-tail adapter protein [Fusobacterium pseudoperiodonticum]PIM78391.1 phage head-tail adapter protein [Fusobacterium pseudoperiodonticum]
MKEILKNIKLGQIIGIYHFEDSCFTVGKISKIDSKYLYLLSYDINFKEDGIKIFLINSIKRIILKSDYIEKNQKKIVRLNRENKDIFQELIENRIKISIDLADGSVEEAYLTEKGEDYFKFKILNDNQNITSEEVITKDYLKRIKISNFIEKEEYKNFKVITTKDDEEYMAYDLSYNGDYLIFLEKEEFYDIAQINIISKNMIDSISEIEIKLDVKRENFNDLIDLKKDLDIIEILRKCLENKFLVFIDNENFFETKVGIVTDLEDNKIKMKEIDKYGNFHKNSEIYLDEIQLLAVKNYKIMEGNHEEKF